MHPHFQSCSNSNLLLQMNPQSLRLRWKQWSVLLFLLAGLSACTASEARSSRPQKSQVIPVVAARVTRQTMPLLVQTTGTVQAYSTIAIKSQIDGQITGVYFREGQMVRRGELLFHIDSRLLQTALDQAVANQAKALAQVRQAQAQLVQAQAQVNQAQATVVRDQAQAKNAAIEAQRYTELVNQGAVTQEQADQYRTNAAAQQATVAADQSNVGNAIAAVESARANVQNALATVNAARAQVETARVQLSYTAIAAPIDGQLGKLNVNQGNLVQANDANPLVTLNQVSPIYVEFSIPQAQLLALKQYQAQHQLPVSAKSPQDSGSPVQGTLVFVDNSVDNTTGTIKLRASFTNADGRLTPGQFVNVVLTLSELPNEIVIPTTAVQAGQTGSFVYVIKPDQTVEARKVITGQTIADRTVIESGLQVGDRVVTDGQFNLAPGAMVREKDPSTPSQ